MFKTYRLPDWETYHRSQDAVHPRRRAQAPGYVAAQPRLRRG